MRVYFTGSRGTFKVRTADGKKGGDGAGELTHLFDQAGEGPRPMVSHFLLTPDGSIPVVVYEEANGLYVEGFKDEPGKVQHDKVMRRMMSLGIEIYYARQK